MIKWMKGRVSEWMKKRVNEWVSKWKSDWMSQWVSVNKQWRVEFKDVLIEFECFENKIETETSTEDR